MSAENQNEIETSNDAEVKADVGIKLPIGGATVLSAILRGLGRNLILRGIVEMIIGVMLLLTPLEAIRVATMVIGALLIVDGIVAALFALRSRGSDRNWTVVNAFVLLIVGVVTVCSPLVMDKLWMIALGVWQIASVITSFFNGGWRRLWSVLSGVLSLVIGIIFIVLPFVALAYVGIIAGCVLAASGFFTICAGADLRIASKDL